VIEKLCSDIEDNIKIYPYQNSKGNEE